MSRKRLPRLGWVRVYYSGSRWRVCRTSGTVCVCLCVCRVLCCSFRAFVPKLPLSQPEAVFIVFKQLPPAVEVVIRGATAERSRVDSLEWS